jgi:hypothetical protein
VDGSGSGSCPREEFNIIMFVYRLIIGGRVRSHSTCLKCKTYGSKASDYKIRQQVNEKAFRHCKFDIQFSK